MDRRIFFLRKMYGKELKIWQKAAKEKGK